MKLVQQGRRERVDVLRFQIVNRIVALEVEIRIQVTIRKASFCVDVMDEYLIALADVLIETKDGLMRCEIPPPGASKSRRPGVFGSGMYLFTMLVATGSSWLLGIDVVRKGLTRSGIDDGRGIRGETPKPLRRRKNLSCGRGLADRAKTFVTSK